MEASIRCLRGRRRKLRERLASLDLSTSRPLPLLHKERNPAMDDEIEYGDDGYYYSGGRRRKAPTTKKLKAAAHARQAQLPAMGATRPVPQPPTAQAIAVAAVPVDQTRGSQDAGPSKLGTGTGTGTRPAPAVVPPPVIPVPPMAPYNYAREEPAYGTFDPDYNNFEIPQKKKRGPVRCKSIRNLTRLSHRFY